MKIITGNTKTTDLIKLADNKPILIVCETLKECHAVYERAISLGINILLPISYSHFLQGRYSRASIESFYIDNIFNFVSYCANGKLGAVSLETSILNQIMENKQC